MSCPRDCNDFETDCPHDVPCRELRRFSGWNGSLQPWRGEPCHAAIPAPAVRQALQAVRERLAAQQERR